MTTAGTVHSSACSSARSWPTSLKLDTAKIELDETAECAECGALPRIGEDHKPGCPAAQDERA